MDIKIDQDGFSFNVRSSCIIMDKKHENVLLTSMRAIVDHDAYLLPGGRVEMQENSYEAVAREIQEELGLSLEYQLVSIEENIVKETHFQMLEFVFYAEVDNFNNIIKLNNGWDNFIVIKIKEIDNYDIRPRSIVSLIKDNCYNNIKHHINYDWGE